MHDGVDPELLPVPEAPAAHVTEVVGGGRVGGHVVRQVGGDQVRLVTPPAEEPAAL